MADAVLRIAESGQVLKLCKQPKAFETMTPAEARGIVWMFEPPKHTATYIIGCDPAMGRSGWDRTIPMDTEDSDNSAIEVFRIGRREETIVDEDGKKRTIIIPTDYQVAEYAGPIDYEQTAAVVNALGRLYRGNGRMGSAHTIIECYPGNGWMVEKTLISKYGYLNFYHRKMIDSLLPTETKGIGWVANKQSVRDLWIHGVKHISNNAVVIRSPWLLSEMETTEPVRFMSYTSEAQSGFHDDRLRAAMLVWWAAHDLSSQIRVETTTTVEKNSKPTNWQSSDLSVDSLKDVWNKRFHEILEGD